MATIEIEDILEERRIRRGQVQERARILALIESDEMVDAVGRHFYEFFGCTTMACVPENSNSFAHAALNAVAARIKG